MSAVTTVDAQIVKGTYDVLRQQLPAVETIDGFLSAHQMAISQLAIAYCDALVEDAGRSTDRSAFFARATSGGFDFADDVYTAFAGGRQVDVIDDLYDRIIGLPGTSLVDLTNVPTRAEVQLEMNNSIDGSRFPDDPDDIGDGLYDRLRSSCPDPAPSPVPDECFSSRTRAIVKGMCASILGSAAMLLQ